MVERFDQPPVLQGDADRKIEMMRSYLIQTIDRLNDAMALIGNGDLSDAERDEMGEILQMMPRDENAKSLKDITVQMGRYMLGNFEGYGLMLDRRISEVKENEGEIHIFAELPAAQSAYRGHIGILQGTSDKAYICLGTNNTYAWYRLIMVSEDESKFDYATFDVSVFAE